MHSVLINGRAYESSSAQQSTRALLELADFRPADDCVLVRVLKHGAVAQSLEEAINLANGEPNIFDAFRTDRIFRFTVDDHGFDWGAAGISEARLREITHVGEEDVIVLERHGEAPRELHPGEEVRFGDKHTDHFVVDKLFVTVFYGKDNIPFELKRGVYTTEELTAKFPIEPGYLLMVVKHDELVTLKPGEKTRVRNGMHFYSQCPGGASS